MLAKQTLSLINVSNFMYILFWYKKVQVQKYIVMSPETRHDPQGWSGSGLTRGDGGPSVNLGRGSVLKRVQLWLEGPTGLGLGWIQDGAGWVAVRVEQPHTQRVLRSKGWPVDHVGHFASPAWGPRSWRPCCRFLTQRLCGLQLGVKARVWWLEPCLDHLQRAGDDGAGSTAHPDNKYSSVVLNRFILVF